MRFVQLLLGGGQDGTLTTVLLPSLEEESRACPAGSNSCGKCGRRLVGAFAASFYQRRWWLASPGCGPRPSAELS